MASTSNDLRSMQAGAGHTAAAGTPLRLAQLTGVLLLSSLACASIAQNRLDELFDDNSKSWTEIAVQLPPLPEPANLLSFDVSNLTTQKFAIDAKSLSVGRDGVVHYSLVATSASGAKNISHEGIRCAANERKIYALGHADGSWSRARRDQWEPIINNAVNRQQAALAQDYFCMGPAIAGSSADILRRLRRHELLDQDFRR